MTRPTYNSSDFWISISYTSGTHYPESGPVVHATVTEGLHPDPTTTEAVEVVTEPNDIGNYRITLPFFGPLGPRPTGQSSPGHTEQNQGTGSEPAVALPITQSTNPNPGQTSSKSRSQIIVGSQTYTENASSQLIIGSQTLQPGGPAITHDGHTISLGSSASSIVIDSSTDITSHLLTKTTSIPNIAPVLTLDDQPVTAISASEYIVGSQTLIPGGPAVTFGGTRISLAPSASEVIIGSSKEALGSIIIGGLRPSGTATSTGARSANATATEAVEAFTGGARSTNRFSSWGAATFLVVIGLVVS